MTERPGPGDVYRSKVEKIASVENEVDERATGNEKTVYNIPGDPDHVLGLFHEYKVKASNETLRQVRARYYLTKLLHLLFPDQVPDVHLATSNPPTIVVDKVNGPHSLEGKDRDERNEFARQIESLGARVDYAYYNFKRNESGDLVYVDSFKPWVIGFEQDGQKVVPRRISLKYSYDALRDAISQLDGSDKETAIQCLDRLMALFNEEKEALEKGALFN